jgi:hypothetical protein
VINWTPDHTRLRDLLAGFYPDQSDARRLCDEAGINQALVKFDSAAINTWHALIRVAETQGRLVALIECVVNERPGHSGLRELRDVFARASQASETRAGSPPRPAADPEEVAHQQKLLETHRRNLAHYLKQQALHGEAYVPPVVVNGIREARDNIRRIKEILRGWSVVVRDHPDDEAA